QSVLVARWDFLDDTASAVHVATIVEDQPRRAARRRVKGNLGLDPAVSAIESHALLSGDLRAAREDAVPRRAFYHGAGQHIDIAKARIPGHGRRHAKGLFAEHHARGLDRIASDIVEPASAELANVADVVRLQFVIAERADGGVQTADAALTDEFDQPSPLR